MAKSKKALGVLVCIGFLIGMDLPLFGLGRKSPDYRMGKFVHRLTAYDLKTKKEISLAEPQHQRTSYCRLSPDGKWIIYVENEEFLKPKEGFLFLVPVGGTEEKRIFGGLGYEIGNLSWLPDSSGFSFVARFYHPNETRDFFFFRVDVNNPDKVIEQMGVKEKGLRGVGDTCWLKDKSGYVFIGGTGGGSTLFRSNMEGTEIHQVGDFPNVRMIDLSPDDKRIVMAWKDDLYVVDVNGENPTQVKNLTRAREYSPVWSPDGEWILYEAFGPFMKDLGFYVVHVATGKRRYVFDHANQPQWWDQAK